MKKHMSAAGRLRAAFRKAARPFGIGLAAASVAAAAPAAAAPAQASIVIDARDNSVIYSRGAHTRVYPASTTKMMTAYLTFEALAQGQLTRDRMLDVSARAAGQPATNLGMMSSTRTRYIVRYVKNKKGQRVPVYGYRTSTTQRTRSISVDDALRGLMVHSGNDAAVVLAEAVGGSVSGFAAKMNATARRLGMTGSHFVNPNGLPSTSQYTTARDMTKLMAAIQTDYPQYYRDYFSVRSFSFNGMSWNNTNRLLDNPLCPGIDGGKTGYIRASGFNMVISAERNGRRTIIGVFGGASGAARNNLACKLVNYAYVRLVTEPASAFDPARVYEVVMPPAPVSPLIVNPNAAPLAWPRTGPYGTVVSPGPFPATPLNTTPLPPAQQATAKPLVP